MDKINNQDEKMILCVSCDKCMPVCPKQIGISGSFSAMNHLTQTGDLDGALEIEKTLVIDSGLKRAGDCIVCGRCEKHCPMKIKIRDRLLEIAAVLK